MTGSLRADMARWQPTARARRHALALLAAEPDAEVAVVPMYQPGKQHGLWFMDQLVCTVPGVVFVAVRSRDPRPGLPALRWATEAASEIARGELRARKQSGTVAYAVVCRDRDRPADVFEDYGNDDE